MISQKMFNSCVISGTVVIAQEALGDMMGWSREVPCQASQDLETLAIHVSWTLLFSA